MFIVIICTKHFYLKIIILTKQAPKNNCYTEPLTWLLLNYKGQDVYLRLIYSLFWKTCIKMVPGRYGLVTLLVAVGTLLFSWFMAATFHSRLPPANHQVSNPHW